MTEKPGYGRAIGLWNPHATLMVLGEKRNETRPNNTNIRGRVFIHSCMTREWDYMTHEPDFFEALLRHNVAPGDLKYGYILGSVDIIQSDQLNSEEYRDWILSDYKPAGVSERSFGNYNLGRWVWFTQNPVRLEKPVRMLGRQGFFWVPLCHFCQNIPVEKAGQCCEPCHFDRMS